MSNPYYSDEQTAAGHGGYPSVPDHQHNQVSANQLGGYPPNSGPTNYGQQPLANVYINTNQPNTNKAPPPPPKTGFTVNKIGLKVEVGKNHPIDVRRCPREGIETATYIKYKYGKLIWLSCVVFFFFSVCLFWVPFCIDDWKDKEYRCAQCHTVKGFKEGRLC